MLVKLLGGLTLSSVLILSPAPAEAKDDIKKGKSLSMTCAACHGDQGKALVPIYPNLAGQNAPYLEMALKGFRDQSKKGGQAAAMYGVAAALSDDDIKALSAYYSSLKH